MSVPKEPNQKETCPTTFTRGGIDLQRLFWSRISMKLRLMFGVWASFLLRSYLVPRYTSTKVLIPNKPSYSPVTLAFHYPQTQNRNMGKFRSRISFLWFSICLVIRVRKTLVLLLIRRLLITSVSLVKVIEVKCNSIENLNSSQDNSLTFYRICFNSIQNSEPALLNYQNNQFLIIVRNYILIMKNCHKLRSNLILTKKIRGTIVVVEAKIRDWIRNSSEPFYRMKSI